MKLHEKHIIGEMKSRHREEDTCLQDELINDELMRFMEKYTPKSLRRKNNLH